MKKNAKKTVVVIALIALMAIPSMMAYFTDVTETKTNTFTVGKVDIELSEPNWDADADGDEAYGEKDAESIVPNQTIEKDPTVTLTKDSENAYVFVKVVVPTYGTDNKDLFSFTANEDWTKVEVEGAKAGEYVYAYDNALAAEGTATLFDEVTVAAVDEAYLTGNPVIKVTAYAIQAENLGDDANTATLRWGVVKNLVATEE